LQSQKAVDGQEGINVKQEKLGFVGMVIIAASKQIPGLPHPGGVLFANISPLSLLVRALV